jgi:cellulose 1,4-beta-cellobiosidase
MIYKINIMTILTCVFTYLALSGSAFAQLAGKVKKNEFPAFPMIEMRKTLQTSLVIDSNWRWVHNKGGYTNCFDTTWNKQFCPDPVTCSKNCELEGVDLKDYKDTYGVTTSGNSATLRYVTGSNVGSRLYVLDEDKKRYKGFNLVNRELVYDIDMKDVPCGLNGALYFIEMPLDGGLNALNQAGAAYGVNYGDGQCAQDIKYINGFVNLNNTGACSIENDIWESNAHATAFTPHSCMLLDGKPMKGVYPCTDPVACGTGNNRFKGVCDKNGADYNPYRLGDLNLYGFGPQFKVNTQKPFRVITQFITQDGTDQSDIVTMRRVYEQDGKVVDGGFLNSQVIQKHKDEYKEPNHFEQLGGWKVMTESFRRNMVFAISLWDDNHLLSNPATSPGSQNSMAWLDSVYPPGSTEPGSKRGPCDPNEKRDIWTLRKTVPNSQYTISNLQVRAITNYPSISPSPVPSPSPTKPSPTPSPPKPSPTPSTPSVPASGSLKIQCKECVFEEL